MKYYLSKNGQTEGPYTVEQLTEMNLTPDTLVWTESMSNWEQASTITELKPLFAGKYPPVPPVAPPPVSNQNQGSNTNHTSQEVCPETYLVFSILCTILCCLPFGIVAIVKSTQVEKLFAMGKYAEAQAASKSAKNWVLAAVITGAVILVLYIIFYISILATYSSSVGSLYY